MKTRIFLIISVLLPIFNFGMSKENVTDESKANKPGQISIFCTNELNGLAAGWALEYKKQYPDAVVNVDVKKPQEIVKSPGSLAFIQGNELVGDPSWKMTIGREIIVPVINSGNTLAYLFENTGVTQTEIRKLFTDPSGASWSAIAGKGQNNPINLYVINDPTVISAVKQFLDLNTLGDHVKMLDNYDQMLMNIKSDPHSLAFCRLSGITDPANQQIMESVRIMPIDKNANGKLDYMENIYSDLDAFTRGVWIGKYPGALIQDIYAVSTAQPSDETQVAFLTWILTAGQVSLANFGFNGLVYSEVQSQLDKFNEAIEIVPPVSQAISVPKLILFILAGIMLLGIVAAAIFGLGRKKTSAELQEISELDLTFNERTMNVPRGLFYDKSHTWAFMDKDGTVKVGVDDFLQHVTGLVTRIEMKKTGERVVKGELLLTLIQKGKRLKLYAPVSGTILERNKSLEYNPSILNFTPYAEGWVYRLEPANWLQEIPLLNMAVKYTAWLSGEFTRLKDFLNASLQSHKLEYGNVVLQDGGELKNNLLEDFGPEVWEDFQVNFIDTYK